MRQILNYLKRHRITDTQTVNRLFVTSFVAVNHLCVRADGFLNRYLITKDDKETVWLSWMVKRIESEGIELNLEDLIRLFEFVISPYDRIVTGAIYTPNRIRNKIIEVCLGDVSAEKLSGYTIADISCGCGGFLMDASLYLYQHTGKSFAEIFRENIFGIDIDRHSIERTKIVLTLLALQNGEDDVFEFNLLREDTLNYYSNQFDDRYRHFDVVVGNPPYVCSRNMSDEIRRKAFAYEVCRYGHPDLYIPFIQIAIESLKEGGELGFITMNSFFNSLNGKGLREYLKEKRLNVRIVDFRDYQVFKSKSTYTCLLFVSNEHSENLHYADAEDGNLEVQHFEQIPYNTLDASTGWNLKNTAQTAIIEKSGTPLGQFCNSRHGIATLSNKTYIFKPQASDEHFYYFEKDGIYYPIEREICRDVVNSNKLNSDVLFESLVEKVIFPYTIDETGRAVIIDEESMALRFPMALDYLRLQLHELEHRDKGHTENYPAWYAYGRTQSLVMPKYKLFFPKIANKSLRCVLIDNPKLLLYNGMAFVSDDLHQLEILKCFMESKIFWEYVTSNAKPYASGFYSLNGVNIKKFGIPKMSKEVVGELLSITNSSEKDAFIRTLYV